MTEGAPAFTPAVASVASPTDYTVAISEAASTTKTLASTVDKFILEQKEINKAVNEAIQSSRTSNLRSLLALAAFVIAAWTAQFEFLAQKTDSAVSPVITLANQNTLAIAALATQTAEQRQKNVEIATQINCLEVIREFENSMKDRDNALISLGAIKLPPGVTMPIITYHPLCQPVATVLAK